MIEPDLKSQSGEESNSEPASVSQLTQPQPPKITDNRGERDDDKTNGDVSMVNQEILLKPAPEPAVPAATTEVEPVVVSKRKSRTRATSSIAKSAAGSGRSRAGSTRRQKKAPPQTVKAEISSRSEQIELQEGSTPTIPATQEDLKNNALVGVTTVVPKPTLPITETTTGTSVKKEKEPNPKIKKPKSGSLKSSAELIASTVPDQTDGGNMNSQSIEGAEVKMELLDPTPKNQKPIAPHPKPKPKPKSKPGPKPKSKPTLLGQVEQDDKTSANSEKDTDMKTPIRKRKRVSSTNRTPTTTDTTSTKTTPTPSTKQKQRKLSTNTKQQLKNPDYPPLLQKFPNLVIKTASLNSCNDTQIVSGAVTVMVDFMELAELKYGYEKVHPKFDNRLVPAIDQSAGGDGEDVVKSKKGNGKNATTGIKTSGKVETRKLQQPVKRSFFVYEGVITEKVLQENY